MAYEQTQASLYPAPIAPSFQSFAERQRMAIDDAIAAREGQEERTTGVLKAGAKAGFEYDKMLRGYMEAKYANPNLTFWEYATKPSVAGAFQAEGRKQIAAHISAGGDIKDVPGMTFGERQKAGLRGIVGADKREREARLAEIAKDEPRVQKMAEQEISEVSAELPENVYESQLKSLKDIKKDVAGVTNIIRKEGMARVKERLTTAKLPELGDLDPAKLLSKSPEATKAAEKSLGTIAKLMEKPDAAAALVKTEPSVIERTAKGAKITGGQYSKVPDITKPVVDVDPVAVWDEPAKGGLKEALGTGVKGLGYAASVASGVKKLQSRDETAQLGGAIQTAGGVAGLVAMTNFWNPVGWAAAIPAVLSVGGSLMGGGGTDPLAKTPLGRYRRRVGIG